LCYPFILRMIIQRHLMCTDEKLMDILSEKVRSERG
jgi:hypothetical protein